VTLEVLILALASTVRPTSIAAVYALLSAPEPRRLLFLYVVTGLITVIAFGVIVVVVFHGANTHRGHSQLEEIVEVIGGVIVLGFGLALQRGLIGGRTGNEAPTANRWSNALQSHGGVISPKVAALAGPATHIPGIFYLVALNTISASSPRLIPSLIEVVIFCAIWFALPIAAWVTFLVKPAATREAVAALQAWTVRNGRVIVITVCVVVGLYLVIDGILGLT
jgi:hypothetical protein